MPAMSDTSGKDTRKGQASSKSTSPGSSLGAPRQLRVPQSEDAYLRFVGDLSPEASFLATRHKQNQNQQPSRHESRHEGVGVWLGQRSDDDVSPEKTQGMGDNPGVQGGRRGAAMTTSSPGPLALPSLRSIWEPLRQECLAMLPPPYEFGLLYNLYYTKVDPIFPIVHGESIEDLGEMEGVALKQGICLVASLDPSMRRHLRLASHPGRVLSPIDFRAHVAAAIKQSLDMGLIQDEMLLLQVCALMALYADRPGCSEISAYYCAQAVHHSQGLGLHIGWPDASAKGQKSRRIFWCVFVLDRLNAATNGRPVIMHSRDMDKRILDSLDMQIPAFRLLIRISQFLDQTITQYRPHSLENTGEAERQTFEDFVQDTCTIDLDSAILASLEMFYLAVVILQSRPRDGASTNRKPSSEIQFFCAASIVSIASDEFRNSVTFWPPLPYAVSMATSVAYKSLRNSALPNNRKRAYGLFHSSCEVLDELSKAFQSAKAVARLATDTLQEVERVAVERSCRNQRSHDTSERTSRTRSATARSRRDGEVADQQPASRHLSQGEAPALTLNDSDENLLSLPSDAATTSLPFNLETFSNFAGEGGIFNDFDPNFDLGRIDALFSANLDPTLPSFSEAWLGEGPFPR